MWRTLIAVAVVACACLPCAARDPTNPMFNVGPNNPPADSTPAMIDAAVLWPSAGSGKYYFFKGTQWASFDIDSKSLDEGFPRAISAGFPELAKIFGGSIDSAVILDAGTAVSPLKPLCFFFKGDQAVIYSAEAPYGSFLMGPVAANHSVIMEQVSNAPRSVPSAATQILPDGCRDHDLAIAYYFNAAGEYSNTYTCDLLTLDGCVADPNVRFYCPVTCNKLGYSGDLCQVTPAGCGFDRDCPACGPLIVQHGIAAVCANGQFNAECAVSCAGISPLCYEDGPYPGCVRELAPYLAECANADFSSPVTLGGRFGGVEFTDEAVCTAYYTCPGNDLDLSLLGFTGCPSFYRAKIAELSARDFVPYFSYDGDLVVKGTITPILTKDITQTFTYALTGVDPKCDMSGAGSAANSCGIHIHSGSSCAEDAGGHYYTGSVAVDPWKNVYYTAIDGVAAGTLSVATGASAADITGKTFIVHAFDGSRIACATIGQMTSGTGVFSSSNIFAARPAISPGGTSPFFQVDGANLAFGVYTINSLGLAESRFIIPAVALGYSGEVFMVGDARTSTAVVSDVLQAQIQAASTLSTNALSTTLQASYIAFAKNSMWPVRLTSSSSFVVSHELVSTADLMTALGGAFGFTNSNGAVYDSGTNWPKIIDVVPSLTSFCEPRNGFRLAAMKIKFGSNEPDDSSVMSVLAQNGGLSATYTVVNAGEKFVEFKLFLSSGQEVYSGGTMVIIEHPKSTISLKIEDTTEVCDDLVSEVKGYITLTQAGPSETPIERNYRFERVEKQITAWAFETQSV